MTPLRARSLLLGHALAANEPIGAELRRGGLANAADAAEAGDLSRALRLAGFPEDVAALAASWPASAAPAQRRLSRLPSTLVFHAPLVQTLCWFGFVAFVQLLVLLVLHIKIVAMFSDFPGPESVEQSLLAGEALFTVLIVPFGIAVISGSVGRFAGWQRWLDRAREASLACALLDSAAPESVRRSFAASCRALAADGGDRVELEGVVRLSLAEAAAAHQRFVSGVRFVGFGILTTLAFGALASVYLSLPRLWSGF